MDKKENKMFCLSVSGNCRLQRMYSIRGMWKETGCCSHAGSAGLCDKRHFSSDHTAFDSEGKEIQMSNINHHNYCKSVYNDHKCQTLSKESIITRIKETLGDQR